MKIPRGVRDVGSSLSEDLKQVAAHAASLGAVAEVASKAVCVVFLDVCLPERCAGWREIGAPLGQRAPVEAYLASMLESTMRASNATDEESLKDVRRRRAPHRHRLGERDERLRDIPVCEGAERVCGACGHRGQGERL